MITFSKVKNFQFTKKILDKVFDIKNEKLQLVAFIFVLFLEFLIRISIISSIVYLLINNFSNNEINILNSFAIAVWISICFNFVKKINYGSKKN